MGIQTSCGTECQPEPEIVLPEVVVPPEDTTEEFLVELVEDGDAADDEPRQGDNDVGLDYVGELGIGSGMQSLTPAVPRWTSRWTIGCG